MNTDRKLNKRRFALIATIAVGVTYTLTAVGLATSGGQDLVTATDVAQQTAIYGTVIAVVLLVLIAGVMIPRSAFSSGQPRSDRSKRVFGSGSAVVDEIGDDDSHRRSNNFAMWGSDNDLPAVSMDEF